MALNQSHNPIKVTQNLLTDLIVDQNTAWIKIKYFWWKHVELLRNNSQRCKSHKLFYSSFILRCKSWDFCLAINGSQPYSHTFCGFKHSLYLISTKKKQARVIKSSNILTMSTHIKSLIAICFLCAFLYRPDNLQPCILLQYEAAIICYNLLLPLRQNIYVAR